MKYLCLFAVGLFLFNCKQTESDQLTAQNIIDESIAVMGGSVLDSSLIEFKFRDKYYSASRKKGIFSYSRQFIDSTSGKILAIADILKNEGFQRIVNKKIVEVPDSMVTKYSASINSVHYFSVLPYGLNDPAVIKQKMTDTRINDTDYYTVQVTFKEQGGGEDFEDVFLYWINKNNFKLDYLAYSYNEDDGKGMRFREAYNERIVGGIRFVDYKNYKPNSESVKLQELAVLFQTGELQRVSKIELKEIRVN